MVRPSVSWAASVFGGKNSNENVRPAASRSAILAMVGQSIGRSFLRQGRDIAGRGARPTPGGHHHGKRQQPEQRRDQRGRLVEDLSQATGDGGDAEPDGEGAEHDRGRVGPRQAGGGGAHGWLPPVVAGAMAVAGGVADGLAAVAWTAVDGGEVVAAAGPEGVG